MVLRREAIEGRLKELDRILEELARQRDVPWETFSSDLSRRWIVERGLIAAAGVILDVADQILSGHFGHYPETYEESLRGLREHHVLSPELYAEIRGLGGFRNILIHRYPAIDPGQVYSHFHKSLEVFPRFGAEVLDWLESVGDD